MNPVTQRTDRSNVMQEAEAVHIFYNKAEIASKVGGFPEPCAASLPK